MSVNFNGISINSRIIQNVNVTLYKQGCAPSTVEQLGIAAFLVTHYFGLKYNTEHRNALPIHNMTIHETDHIKYLGIMVISTLTKILKYTFVYDNLDMYSLCSGLT